MKLGIPLSLLVLISTSDRSFALPVRTRRGGPPDCRDLITRATRPDVGQRLREEEPAEEIRARVILAQAWLTGNRLAELGDLAGQREIRAELEGIGGDAGSAVIVWRLTGAAENIARFLGEDPGLRLVDFERINSVEIIGLGKLLEDLGHARSGEIEARLGGRSRRLAVFHLDGYTEPRLAYLQRVKGRTIHHRLAGSLSAALHGYQQDILWAEVTGGRFVIGEAGLLDEVRQVNLDKLKSAKMVGAKLAPQSK